MHADSFLYSGQQARAIDARAIEQEGILGIHLMKKAGSAAFEHMLSRYTGKIGIICGSGNNAGDGYIVAALALQRSLPVCLIQLGSADTLKGDAAIARDWALQCGLKIQELTTKVGMENLNQCGVIVDAMLGTGLSGDVRPLYKQCIDTLNSWAIPILAIDLPSGLNSHTGCVHGSAVRADLTVTFIVAKQGLYTAEGPAHAGEIVLEGLGIPASIPASFQGVEALNWADYAAKMPGRDIRANSNKNKYGHVLVVGGDKGMGGAVCMTAQTALRCGAGMVSVITRPEHLAGLLSRQPELMALGVDDVSPLGDHDHHLIGHAQGLFEGQIEALMERVSSLVIGPGLGTRSWGQGFLQLALEYQMPMLFDADALNLVARIPALASRLRDLPEKILTPHPGEAGRLLGCSPGEVQQDRFAAARELSQKYQASIVLKGAGTVIRDENTGVCMHGNAAMATAGMGDMLSGVIAAFLAQGVSCGRAARAGVCLHSAAADLAVEREGAMGLVATDLLPCLRELQNS